MQHVFNIGFNKSGTTSLCAALNYIGLPSLHYRYKNKPLDKIIIKNINRKRNLFYMLDDKYVGFTDFTGEKYYRTVFQQYPNSKFIFTTRNIDDWIKSSINHMLNEKKIRPNQVKETIFDLSNFYINKSAEIRDFFKSNKDQFLEMRICDGEGWEVLCPFLSLEIPSVPFPYENKTLYKK